MPLVEYAIFHPWKAALTVISGVLLGVSAFLAYQVSATLSVVATEDFDPDAVRAVLTEPPSRWVWVEPEPIPGEGEEFDLIGLQEELAAAFDITKPFDPYEFSPYSFGEPIADEVFTSYLLIGTDASGFRADAIILGLQPNGGGRPIVISLPRDLYLWNSCRQTFTRLNSGLGGCSGVASGSEMMAILVQEYTGIPIDHVARINFDGFARLVDAMGGTTICVDYPTRDPKSHLDIPAGCQVADGATTLAWVRSRRTEQLIDEEWVVVAGSDYIRQRRQQDVLFQLAQKAAGFSSPTSLADRLSAIAESVRLDSSWSFGEAVTTGWKYRGLSSESVSRFSIAARNYRTPRGAQVLLPTAYFKDQLASVYSLG